MKQYLSSLASESPNSLVTKLIYEVKAIHVEPFESTNYHHIKPLGCSVGGGPVKAFLKEFLIGALESGHKANVRDAYGSDEVKVVRANPKYLRTVKDGSETDNLLSLARF